MWRGSLFQPVLRLRPERIEMRQRFHAGERQGVSMTSRVSEAGVSLAHGVSRRFFVLGGAAFVAGCSSARFSNNSSANLFGDDLAYGGIYGPISTEPFPIPAVNLSQINPAFYRRRVRVPGSIPDKPGTIVVDPGARYLYLVHEDGMAIRYGIGVGREGFGWNGSCHGRQQTGMAEVVPAEGDGRARSARRALRQRHGWRPPEPARRACALLVPGQERHAFPHSRHQRAGEHRQGRLVGLHPHAATRM